MTYLRILILCTGNSCRSQMTHGFLNHFDQNLHVRSAGTQASGKINQKAVAVMLEAGINISHHTSDPIENYLDQAWDYVITVCDDAKETCPVFFGQVKHKLHMGFEDPSDAIGTEEHIMSEFRRIRDEINTRFKDWYDDLSI